MKIKGINVFIYTRKQSGVDGFGAETFEETKEEVSNVLVYPSTPEEVAKSLNTLYAFQKVTLINGATQPLNFSIKSGEQSANLWNTLKN